MIIFIKLDGVCILFLNSVSEFRKIILHMILSCKHNHFLLLFGWKVAYLSVFWNIFSNCVHNVYKISLLAFVRFLSTVRFQMCPQMTCLRRGIVTLVAFVWFFSTVCFQMCPQTVYPRGCIVTLVAFIWLFSTMRFQMCPQMVCPRRCIVTLVAFVWLFSTVCY